MSSFKWLSFTTLQLDKYTTNRLILHIFCHFIALIEYDDLRKKHSEDLERVSDNYYLSVSKENSAQGS